jgi:hypothetical protein
MANREWRIGVSTTPYSLFAAPHSLTYIVAPSTHGANSAPPRDSIALVLGPGLLQDDTEIRRLSRRT